MEASWQPVLLFAAASRAPRFATRLVEELLGPEEATSKPSTSHTKGAASDDPTMRTRKLLALQCRAVAVRFDPALNQRLDRTMKEMFPPQNMEDAEALAGLSDAVVPFLKHKVGLDAQAAAASVRTLRLIGSPFARRYLEAYTDDERYEVVVELAQAFNPLKLKQVQQILRAGKSLDLAIATQVTDLTPLAEFTTVQSLNLARTGVTDLSPLAGLTSLQSLDLCLTPVIELTPLGQLNALRLLDLTSTLVTDLRPLARLAALQVLNLAGTLVTDLRPLAGLTAIRVLDLTRTPLTDLTPLAALANLDSLVLPDGRTVSAKAIPQTVRLWTQS